MERTILHSDINCCYAAIEHLHHPELAGKPLAVGGDPESRHGIVLTADYIAKKHGVKTGMALWQAKQVCPDITFISPRMDLYLRFSRMAHEIYSVGNSTTTPRDLENDEDVKIVLYILAESVAARLRENGFRCRMDGLTGFPQAIEAVYPKNEIQQCIIHQIRNSTKFVSYKDIKKLMADLKLVYAAPTEETALNELELFKDKWDSKYPKIYKSWHDNWATLSTYFKYPEAVRRLIYTTNAIEGFNRQLRKVTKSKTVLPSDDSLLKMLYLATMDITRKWTGHRQDWGQIHSQLEIYFEERLSGKNL